MQHLTPEESNSISFSVNNFKFLDSRLAALIFTKDGATADGDMITITDAVAIFPNLEKLKEFQKYINEVVEKHSPTS